MTKKSNAVELVSVFGKIKPCGLNSHGNCSGDFWCQTPGTNWY